MLQEGRRRQRRDQLRAVVEGLGEERRVDRRRGPDEHRQERRDETRKGKARRPDPADRRQLRQGKDQDEGAERRLQHRFRQGDDEARADQRAQRRAGQKRQQRAPGHGPPLHQHAPEIGGELHQAVDGNQHRHRQHRAHDGEERQPAPDAEGGGGGRGEEARHDQEQRGAGRKARRKQHRVQAGQPVTAMSGSSIAVAQTASSSGIRTPPAWGCGWVNCPCLRKRTR